MSKVMALLDEHGRVRTGNKTHAPDCQHALGFTWQQGSYELIDAELVEDDIERCGFGGGGDRVTPRKYRTEGVGQVDVSEEMAEIDRVRDGLSLARRVLQDVEPTTSTPAAPVV